MTVRISDAYRLLRRVAAASPGCTLDLRDLDREVADADSELARDEELFDENVARVVLALAGSGVPVDHALSTLAVFAMNLSTIFSNLAGDLEKLVVYRRDSMPGAAGPG